VTKSSGIRTYTYALASADRVHDAYARWARSGLKSTVSGNFWTEPGKILTNLYMFLCLPCRRHRRWWSGRSKNHRSTGENFRFPEVFLRVAPHNLCPCGRRRCNDKLARPSVSFTRRPGQLGILTSTILKKELKERKMKKEGGEAPVLSLAKQTSTITPYDNSRLPIVYSLFTNCGKRLFSTPLLYQPIEQRIRQTIAPVDNERPPFTTLLFNG
jgi:hypothetical protein